MITKQSFDVDDHSFCHGATWMLLSAPVSYQYLANWQHFGYLEESSDPGKTFELALIIIICCFWNRETRGRCMSCCCSSLNLSCNVFAQWKYHAVRCLGKRVSYSEHLWFENAEGCGNSAGYLAELLSQDRVSSFVSSARCQVHWLGGALRFHFGSHALAAVSVLWRYEGK